MCFERQWFSSQPPGPVLVEHFHYKATIVFAQTCCYFPIQPHNHKASCINFRLVSHLNPLGYLYVLWGLFGFELVLFCVLEEVWEINDGEFGRGTLLTLLSDFDVRNMCGPGDVPDERAGVYLCEGLLVWVVCRSGRPAGSFLSPGSKSVSGASGLAQRLGGVQFTVLLHHPYQSSSASQHWQNNNNNWVRLFTEQVTRDMDDCTRCVITPRVFFYRDERTWIKIKAKSFIRNSVML